MKHSAYAYSYNQFVAMCDKQNINDSNVEELKDLAFIEVMGTDACQTQYLENLTPPVFDQNHSNVLVVTFDDLTEDYLDYKAMTEEQADEIVDFIEKNLDKNFRIHCLAGISRSGAIRNFIVDFYPDEFEDDEYERNLKHPNNHVLCLLKRAFYEKHGIFQ